MSVNNDSIFEVVIGLEVHAQLKTKTKLFCGCSTAFGSLPNSHTCPVCLGMPGALPVLNKQAVTMAIQAGHALNCDIQTESVFARKNYFYPDLPKGYQISQFDKPICLNGHLDITVNGETKTIGVTRIHMEEDAGKLLHQGADAIAGATHSLVDLNRACVPLIEIVSEPDLRSAEEARIYMETLKITLEHLGVCDGNLEEGSLRADANISLRKKGDTKLGTRTEIKNLNSFKSVERAILAEVERQTESLLAGKPIVQQTRHFDDATQKTRVLRSKENAHDYRYFSDPDLLPLVLDKAFITSIKEAMPELPMDRKKRFMTQFGLSDADSMTLISDIDMLHYFETVVQNQPSDLAKELSKWVIGDLNALLKQRYVAFADCKVSPSHLQELVNLIQQGTLSGKMAKTVLQDMVDTGKTPKDLVAQSGLAQISDSSQLQSIVDSLLDANLDVIEKVKAGKTNAADFLMGQVMKQTKGQAKPDLVRQLLLESIAKR